MKKYSHCRRLIILCLLCVLCAGISAQSLFDRCTAMSTIKDGEKLLGELSSYTGIDRVLLMGIVYHNMSYSGDRAKYVPKAKETLEKLRATNPVARAYYGSTLTLEAGIAFAKNDILNAALLLQKGFDDLDAAVKAEPDSITVRVLRIENSITVSAESPFKRTEVLDADIVWLAGRWEKSTATDKAMLFFYRGEYANLKDDLDAALGFYEKAMKAAPGTPAAVRANRRILELEE